MEKRKVNEIEVVCCYFEKGSLLMIVIDGKDIWSKGSGLPQYGHIRCFSHSAYWLPTRKNYFIYTMANPARGLLNREKRTK